MGARPIFGITGLVCLAGAIVMTFFILLAGAINTSPMTLVYFLEVDTSRIINARPLTAWTVWGTCGVTSADTTTDCTPPTPAFPLDPPNNFGTSDGVPADFIVSNRYYYMTRIFFGFLIAALFVAVCSLLLGLFALCSRVGAYLSSMLCVVAWVLQTVAAALMTAAYVTGRNAFQANGQNATLGRYGFAFVWAPMALMLIATVLFCVGGATSREGGRRRSRKNRRSVLDGDASSFTRA